MMKTEENTKYDKVTTNDGMTRTKNSMTPTTLDDDNAAQRY